MGLANADVRLYLLTLYVTMQHTKSRFSLQMSNMKIETIKAVFKGSFFSNCTDLTRL